MNKNAIWAYYIEFSKHMWDDENTPGRGWYDKPKWTDGNEVDLAVWDETVRYLADQGFNMLLIDVGDGMQYEKHPEISAPDAWSKDFFRKKLDELRTLGIEPIPKLNFSTCHHAWLKEYRRMVSTPKYYEVCADLIGEVCEVFDSPRLMHLGLDEERAASQIYREMVITRGSKLWWNDVYFFFNECEKHGMRPWIWADYYQDHPDEFAEKMPRSTLLSNWFYHAFTDYPENNISYKRIKTYEGLEALGFDQVPAGSTFVINDNLRQTMAHAKKTIAPERLKGFLATAWYNISERNRLCLLNEAYQFNYGRKVEYPESF